MSARITLLLLTAFFAVGCARSGPADGLSGEERIARAADAGVALDTAIFAGGCFWCMEPPFDETDGVLATTSGFTGGHVENPSYGDVTGGDTGHTEAVRIVYDPARVGYDTLLDVFWPNVDPLDVGGQFCDRGAHYRSGIFYRNSEQQRLADASKAALDESGRFTQPIVTEVTAATEFYEAEEYHQDYYRKNPIRYRVYRANCGRDGRLAEVWESG